MNVLHKAHHIFLTGLPGTGKTTLVKKIYGEILQSQHGLNGLPSQKLKVQGFYTEETTGGLKFRMRTGYRVVSVSDGTIVPLAGVTAIGNGPRVGKFTVFVDQFEKFSLDALSIQPGVRTLLIIDEVGKMECLSREFCTKIEQLVLKKNSIQQRLDHVIFGTIPIKTAGFFTPDIIGRILRSDNVKLFEITPENRDTVEDAVKSALLELF